MLDLIVIGGGISGLGVAREALRAGLNTTLLEAGQCGEQTSNNSLRIIHGGFRYLQSLDLPRTLRSLKDQRALLSDASSYVRPLHCLMPLTRMGLKSVLPVTCASALYSAALTLAGSPLDRPRIVGAKEISKLSPALAGVAPYGALRWTDAIMDDPLAVRDLLVSQLRDGGGEVIEGARVSRVARVGESFLVYSEDGRAWPAKRVVNALGPWLRDVELPDRLARFEPRWCKAYNVIVRKQIDPVYALGVEGVEKRLFFAAPRGDTTAIGTWYVPIHDHPESVHVTEEELVQFLRAFGEALPSAGLSLDDVVGTDVGILPMIADSDRGPVLYGSEKLHHSAGYVEILSTKYTTFRSQGRAALSLLGIR